MGDCIVLYPSAAIGHLISMVELGKLCLLDYPNVTVEILVINPRYNTGSTAPYINRVSTANPSIKFHHFPTLSLPLDIGSPNPEALAFELLRLNIPNVQQALNSISQTTTLRAFILDMFCIPSLDVAAKLNIPAYVFFTSGAGFLSLLLYLPTIHNRTTASFKDLDEDHDVPGLPPIPSSDMPLPWQNRTDKAYEYSVYTGTLLPKAAGIIINTFESLEPRPLKAISDGLCVLDGPTPPTYCIGPLITTEERSGTGGDRQAAECLPWLNAQPCRSVVFLCFGSLGLFSAEQLKEIAIGLEKSGQRFLWVVRSPPTEDPSKRFLAPPYPDLDVLLPEGFLDRTRDRGLVVKSWAPQVEVLSHGSVGGFVTHCGWNSVLEAICAGVPMVAWPLYAEQRLNKVFLVEEMKLAMPVEGSDKGGLVSASKVEKCVKGLMESEEGKALADRTLAMKESAALALNIGGSSRAALAVLAKSLMLN